MQHFKFLLSIFIIAFSSTTVMAQEMPPAQVVTAPITMEDVAENQSFTGLLYYDRTSQVSSEIAGLAKKVLVKEGSIVKKGDPLVVLDIEILQQEIAIHKSKISQIDLLIKHAEKNYNRLKKLYENSGVSEKDFDDAVYAHQDALKEKQGLETTLAKLLLQKKKSTIYAPFAGIVLTKNVDSGDWIQQGKLLVSLGSTSDLYIKVPIAESLLQFVKSGQQVPVTINAFNRQLTGIVKDFAPIADPKTKNIFIKVSIPPQERVAANMSAAVFIPTSTERQLSIIPRDALIKFQGKDFVYTVKEGKASILPINIVSYQAKTVAADNPYFVAGMPVVIEGNERLRPDQAVSVAGEK